jgi:hypothetical protein
MRYIVKCCSDYLIHIVIFVLTESAAEEYILGSVCQLLILSVKLVVKFVINRVVGLITLLPSLGIFSGDDGGGLLAKFKVLMLDNPGKINLVTCIVDYSYTLIVFFIQFFGFKSQ